MLITYSCNRTPLTEGAKCCLIKIHLIFDWTTVRMT